MKDSLLATFTKSQKQYIIKHLYPEINKALIHFISEAKRCNQIEEHSTPGVFNKQPSIFGEAGDGSSKDKKQPNRVQS